MIAPHILIISLFLSTTWGIYLAFTIQEYREARTPRLSDHQRRRGDVVSSLRRVIVALNIWLICFAYVFRTGCVLIGIGDEAIAQVLFFSLLGTNVVGSIFAIVSLKYD